MSQSPPPGTVYTPPSQRPPDGDTSLSAVDWILIVLCSIVAFIIGIIRVIQGKPNGPKMLGFSVLSMVIGGILGYVRSHK